MPILCFGDEPGERRREDPVKADYSSFGLKDRVAIVTGASQGIGRAVALGLARAALTWF